MQTQFIADFRNSGISLHREARFPPDDFSVADKTESLLKAGAIMVVVMNPSKEWDIYNVPSEGSAHLKGK